MDRQVLNLISSEDMLITVKVRVEQLDVLLICIKINKIILKEIY